MLLARRKRGEAASAQGPAQAALRETSPLFSSPSSAFPSSPFQPVFSPSSRRVDDFFRSFVLYMKHQNGLNFSDLVELYVEKPSEMGIPLSVFSAGLSPSESICKYLRENHNLSFSDIGALLGRDERSIWTSYRRACKKTSEPFAILGEDIQIPLALVAERDLSILEHIMLYLAEHTKLRVPDVARMLGKHPSALHTALRRAQKKRQQRSGQQEGEKEGMVQQDIVSDDGGALR